MSVDTFDLGLRLRALEQQVPVPRTSTRHLALRKDAEVVVVVTMTGEPDAIWGFWSGIPGGSRAGAGNAVPDPREFPDQVALFSELGARFKKAHDRAGDDWFPQLVMLSEAAWRHLHAASARIAYVDDLDARYAAEMMLWCAERLEHPGTQAVTILPWLLAEHWVTPAPVDEENLTDTWVQCFEHLPGFVAPKARNPFDHPDDARTTPTFDVGYAHKLERFARTRAADRRATAAAQATRILPELKTVVASRWDRASQLLRFYRQDPRPVLEATQQAAEADLDSWKQFRKARDAGFKVARQDRFRVAVRGMQSREQATEWWDKTLIVNDALCRARAVHIGTVIEGTVVSVRVDEFTVRTEQPVIRFRPGTTVEVTGHDGTAGTVIGLRVDGDATLVRVGFEDLKFRDLIEGSVVTVTEPAPDTGRDTRSRINTSQRLRALSWVHDPEALPPATLGRPVPTDLRGTAERLRSA